MCSIDARWVTGQHAGGEIECLTGSLDQMWPMRHRSPALSIPPGDPAGLLVLMP